MCNGCTSPNDPRRGIDDPLTKVYPSVSLLHELDGFHDSEQARHAVRAWTCEPNPTRIALTPAREAPRRNLLIFHDAGFHTYHHLGGISWVGGGTALEKVQRVGRGGRHESWRRSSS